MTAREKAKDPQSAGDKPKRKGGRPPSPRAQAYLWYGGVPEFEGTPWWKQINWANETSGKRAKRSAGLREGHPTVKFPGFLWEAIRRFPETGQLVEGLSRLFPPENVGEKATFGMQAARLRGQNSFTTAVGMEAFEALKVLKDRWKHSYDSLDLEWKAKWDALYLALWHRVGQPGTVPSSPPEFPEGPERYYAEQWRTAFDLLRWPDSIEDSAEGYEIQPVCGLFLPKFAKLRPSGGTLAEMVNPVNVALSGKTKPATYPWVSLGILEMRLAKFQMHPVVLAVDLSKDTDSILRDLKHIINEKRKSLRVCMTDRRISAGSFERIRDLDGEVLKKPGNPQEPGKPPLTRTVENFEGAAKLDLKFLVTLMDESLKQAKEINVEDDQCFEAALNHLRNNPPSATK